MVMISLERELFLRNHRELRTEKEILNNVLHTKLWVKSKIKKIITVSGRGFFVDKCSSNISKAGDFGCGDITAIIWVVSSLSFWKTVVSSSPYIKPTRPNASRVQTVVLPGDELHGKMIKYVNTDRRSNIKVGNIEMIPQNAKEKEVTKMSNESQK